MPRPFPRLVLFAALGLFLACPAAARSSHHAAGHVAGAPVLLSRQPGTAQDEAARELAAHDLHTARRHGEAPLVLVGSARLAVSRADRDEALFVQLQSASLCGSGGCSTSVYLRHAHRWRLILDSVSGLIRVLPASHDGMHDLLVGPHDRWVWDGHGYRDTLAAPSLAGLRQSMLRHRARHLPPD